MTSVLWSYVLSLLGATSYLLAVRGIRVGLWVGVGTQFVWASYALISGQYGFLFSVALFGSINVYGLMKPRKDKNANQAERLD